MRQRFDPTFHRRNVGIDAVRLSQAQDRLHDGENVSCPMVDFTGEEGLPLFRPPPLGDVGGDAADPDNAIVVVERRHRRAGAPPDFAIRAVHAKLGLVGTRA